MDFNRRLHDLDALVPEYAKTKAELDAVKKEADEFGKEIKTILADMKLKQYSAGGYTVTRVVSNRETINEQSLLQVAKKYNLPVIKTVEVVDMDMLENYLYHNELTEEQSADFAKCKSTTEVVQLRIKEDKK